MLGRSKKKIILQKPLEDDADSHVSKQRMALSKHGICHIIMSNNVSVCLLSVVIYLRKATLVRRTKKQASLLYAEMIRGV